MKKRAVKKAVGKEPIKLYLSVESVKSSNLCKFDIVSIVLNFPFNSFVLIVVFWQFFQFSADFFTFYQF